MSTPAENVEAHVDEGAAMAEAASQDAPLEAPPAEIVSDDSDLSEDFAEMDEAFSKDFSDQLEETVPVVEPEIEPEAEVVAEEVEATTPSIAEETPTEEPVEQTIDEVRFELLNAQKELAEARVEQLQRVEETPAEVEATETVSDESFKAAREQAHAGLLEQYALSQEDADRVLTEPESILPQIAANLHLSVMQSVFQGLRGQLPGWIEAVQKENLRQETEHGAIFEAFPVLKGHESAVDTMVAQYRQFNPGATPEDVASKGGAMAVVALGLQEKAATNAAPRAVPVKATPHRPAGATGRASTPPAPSTNEFDLMSQEDVFDD